MSELKPRITENGIDYILVGDYYIPDLKLPEEHRPIGKYGRMHREYLREVHPARLNTLILTGELWTYVNEYEPNEDCRYWLRKNAQDYLLHFPQYNDFKMNAMIPTLMKGGIL